MRSRPPARLLLLAMAAAARAYTCGDRLQSIPSAGTMLPPNGVIMLQGTGRLASIVADAVDHRPVLIGPKGEVPLEVRDAHVGGPSLAQVVLEPTMLLEPGARYRLSMSGVASEELTAWSEYEREYLPLCFTASETADTKSPAWSAPLAVRSVSRSEGPGQEVVITLDLPVMDDGPALMALVCIVPEGAPGDAHELWLPVRAWQVDVHVGACWQWRLDPARRYTISVTPIDLAGNAGPKMEASLPARAAGRRATNGARLTAPLRRPEPGPAGGW